jgi:hypothetical protein
VAHIFITIPPPPLFKVLFFSCLFVCLYKVTSFSYFLFCDSKTFAVSLHPKCCCRRKVFFYFVLSVFFNVDVCCYSNLKMSFAYFSKRWNYSESVVCWMCARYDTTFLYLFSFFTSNCENAILSIKATWNAPLWKIHAVLHAGCHVRMLFDSCRICGSYWLGFTPLSNLHSAFRHCLWFRRYLVRCSGLQLFWQSKCKVKVFRYKPWAALGVPGG